MNGITGIANRVASMIIGAALAVTALVLIALGMTFLPVIGILLAVPVMGMSLYFLNPKVSVELVAEAAQVVCEGDVCWCALPVQSSDM
jgi:hypothetical protein